MALLETPSRILRRMDALQAQDSDLPSLPSMPAFDDDSVIQSFAGSSAHSLSPKDFRTHEDEYTPYHSTPAPMSSHTTRSTMRLPPSTSSSATRFVSSMRASTSTARRSQEDREESFEVSEILPGQLGDSSSSASLPDFHLPPEHDETQDQIYMEEVKALSNTQGSVRRSPSIPDERRCTSSKKYDYSVSLRSEPQPSPIHVPHNVSSRKLLSARIRTPSLSRTTPSPTSTSPNSTPRSTYSPLPRDLTPPVPLEDELSESEDHSNMASDREGDSHLMDEKSSRHEDEANPDEEEQLQNGLQHNSSGPSFSSEEHPQSSESGPARTPFPNAFSSPPSMMASPTPSFPLRASSDPVEATPKLTPGMADDLATPYNRRRSFLLSLVHSTTRPRMTFPTPHPHPRTAEPTHRRPHPHPLSQAWTPVPSQRPSSLLGPGSGSDSGSSHSPHDRLSFISTASSHDLTVHPRANASFDPAMGSKGVGRFNALKLNTYLHGLNRRLQEENETLVIRLRMHGEEVEMGRVAEELEREGFKGVEEAVLEEIEAMRNELEGCELERDALQMEKDALVKEVDDLGNDRGEVRAELDAERQERQRDKERWKERMAEVESGVEGVIKELERRLEEAERDARGKANTEDRVRELEERCNSLQDEIEIANDRAKKAEDALASSSDLGAEVKQANGRAAAHREEVRVISERANALERRLQDAGRHNEQLRAASENQLAELDAELRHSLEAQQSAEAHALELEAEMKTGEDRVDDLEEQLTVTRMKVAALITENEDLQARLGGLKEDSARATETARQMENALEESERKMIADEEELASLRARAAHLERELEAHRERSKASVVTAQDLSPSRSREAALSDVDIEQLETELDHAHREIARLNYMLSESPSRKAIEKAKDMRIELLEKEKDELFARVHALKALAEPLPGKPSSPSASSPTPHRHVLALRTPKTPGGPLKDYSWLHSNTTAPSPSPLVSQIETLRKELNKANDSIDDKVDKLEEAGMDIVGLTERLEDARTRIVALENEIGRLVRREERHAHRLERARCLKCGGRVQLGNVAGVDEGNQSSVLSSTTLPSDPPTPPSKTTEALRSALKTANSELSTLRSQWESERKQLIGEKVVLQNAANRLNMELGIVKNTAKQALESGRQTAGEEAKDRTNVEAELGKAKLVVDDLEDALRAERARLRALSTEQNRMTREKEGILVQLQRAQSDMDDVKDQLEMAKRGNRELEAELRATVTIDQKARLLEAKVSENQGAIEQLRGERQSLAADHADLQRRYVETSAHVTRLRQELAASQTAHDEHRHQLDLRVNEIEELHHDLSQQARELKRIESEKDHAWADRSGIVRTVASLESDLRRVRHDAEALGRVLRELKVERAGLETKHRDELDKVDRAHKQLYAQYRLANEQLEAQREKTKRAIANLEDHVCSSNEQDMGDLRAQHKNECKGLMVQIRYLKAKFTRESALRADLGYQKHYLLEILESFEKSEKQALAMIAKIGVPSPQSKQNCKRRTLRAIAVAALFIARARRASDIWREQSAPKSAVTAALQDVRRRRVAGSLGYL